MGGVRICLERVDAGPLKPPELTPDASAKVNSHLKMLFTQAIPLK